MAWITVVFMLIGGAYAAHEMICPDETVCPLGSECIYSSDQKSYSCSCNNFFQTDDSFDVFACKDIKECDQQDNCLASQTCKSIPGQDACLCDAGSFLSDFTCHENNCANAEVASATCSSTDEKICFPGYNKFVDNEVPCSDVNECASGNHDCDLSVTDCVNTLGSYTCQCKQGYEQNIEECKIFILDETPLADRAKLATISLGKEYAIRFDLKLNGFDNSRWELSIEFFHNFEKFFGAYCRINSATFQVEHDGIIFHEIATSTLTFGTFYEFLFVQKQVPQGYYKRILYWNGDEVHSKDIFDAMVEKGNVEVFASKVRDGITVMDGSVKNYMFCNGADAETNIGLVIDDPLLAEVDRVCTDIDECADDNNNICDALYSTCYNLAGDYECRCNDPYVHIGGDNKFCGVCHWLEDVEYTSEVFNDYQVQTTNECLEKCRIDSKTHAYVSAPDFYVGKICRCLIGEITPLHKIGARSCALYDVNVCSTNVCFEDTNRDCNSANPGEYDCTCKNGFKEVDGDCIEFAKLCDVDPECPPNKHCEVIIDAKECRCDAGYTEDPRNPDACVEEPYKCGSSVCGDAYECVNNMCRCKAYNPEADPDQVPVCELSVCNPDSIDNGVTCSSSDLLPKVLHWHFKVLSFCGMSEESCDINEEVISRCSGRIPCIKHILSSMLKNLTCGQNLVLEYVCQVRSDCNGCPSDPGFLTPQCHSIQGYKHHHRCGCEAGFYHISDRGCLPQDNTNSDYCEGNEYASVYPTRTPVCRCKSGYKDLYSAVPAMTKCIDVNACVFRGCSRNSHCVQEVIGEESTCVCNEGFEPYLSNCRVIPKWDEWDTSGDCSKPCGGGVQKQRRECIPTYGDCMGDNHREVQCNMNSCAGTVLFEVMKFCALPKRSITFTDVPHKTFETIPLPSADECDTSMLNKLKADFVDLLVRNDIPSVRGFIQRPLYCNGVTNSSSGLRESYKRFMHTLVRHRLTKQINVRKIKWLNNQLKHCGRRSSGLGLIDALLRFGKFSDDRFTADA